ncbi:hypothetical protein GNI_159310 [Gregarina niphandrodes]|uniref:Uncharacterized protein n=1 Tax=Gregarina niphandrodes TaxID=110365 RepID=A0A023AZ56_GRENI|nr:hypothetical protein GNI_159310 [Gregarina niphandrodes]EZG43778.1 hypothetical protein GNI_159310 [Gregarina niphandrodes]|eukprot:XP_011134609.1 hypothetical protein GNI_159310 [Gregarina niphandrodes]
MSFALQEEMIGLIHNQSTLIDIRKQPTLSTTDGEEDEPPTFEEPQEEDQLEPQDVAFVDYLWQLIMSLLLVLHTTLACGYDRAARTWARVPSSPTTVDVEEVLVMDGVMACTPFDDDDDEYFDHFASMHANPE